MPNPIVVIHAEDTELFALKLVTILTRCGYDIVTFSHIVEGQIPTKIRSSWTDSLNRTPVYIIIYSHMLLQDKFIVEAIYDIQIQKKSIFVNTNSNITLPTHYANQINLFVGQDDFYRGLNKLTHRLNKTHAIWPAYPHEIEAMIAKERLMFN